MLCRRCRTRWGLRGALWNAVGALWEGCEGAAECCGDYVEALWGRRGVLWGVWGRRGDAVGVLCGVSEGLWDVVWRLMHPNGCQKVV